MQRRRLNLQNIQQFGELARQFKKVHLLVLFVLQIITALQQQEIIRLQHYSLKRTKTLIPEQITASDLEL